MLQVVFSSGFFFFSGCFTGRVNHYKCTQFIPISLQSLIYFICHRILEEWKTPVGKNSKPVKAVWVETPFSLLLCVHLSTEQLFNQSENFSRKLLFGLKYLPFRSLNILTLCISYPFFPPSRLALTQWEKKKSFEGCWVFLGLIFKFCRKGEKK